MRQRRRMNNGANEVRPAPPLRFARGSDHGADGDPARKHTTEPRCHDHRTGGDLLAVEHTLQLQEPHARASAPCGAAMPTTLPSVAMALARNSGCAQLSTTLECSSTFDTSPTNPSGLTTADSGRTPSRRPADTTKLNGLVGSGWCRISAET